MSDTAPKANRRWIILPWAIVIVALIGWSAYWTVGARQIGAAMDTQAQALRAAGYTVQWKSRSIGGYPFHFDVKLAGAQMGEPAGWGASAPALEAETSALTPGVIVFVAPSGMTLNRPDKPPLTVTGSVLRMSLGGFNKKPARISIEGQNLKLAPAAGDQITFVAIDRFEARLRPEDGDKASLFFRIDKATPAQDNLLSRVAKGAPVTVGLEGMFTKASGLAGGNLSKALDAWLSGGGQLEVTRGGIAFGETSLVSLKPSTLGADPDGHLNGKLRLTTDRAGEAMMALGEIAVLPSDTAAVASGLGAGQALLSLGGNSSLTLQFHDGKTWLGPVPLGRGPRLFETPDSVAPQ